MHGLMMNCPLSLGSLLERTGRLFGKVEVVSRRPDRSLARTSYATLHRRARQLAGALTGIGLARGERVASLMWNHATHLEAYFGVPLATGVLHTLNARLHPDELAYIVHHAADRMLIVDDTLLPLYERFRAKVRVERVFVVPTTGKPVPEPYEDYEDLLQRATGEFGSSQMDEDEPAVLCFTSGTTGLPKGVLYSHRSMVLHSLCVSLPDCFDLSQNECVLPAVPLFHVNAWGLPHAAAMVGAKLVLPGAQLDPGGLLQLFEQERVTRSVGVPTVWTGVLDLLDREPRRWKLHPNLRVISGGSTVSKELIRGFARHGICLLHSWGMTETSPLAAMGVLKSYLQNLPEEQRDGIRAKQGLPLPLLEIRAVAGEAEVPWDGQSAGELQIRGPWVASGYYDPPPDQQERWTSDGWLRTGDVVTIDAEGYIQIVDRAKDLIKSGGEWIGSVELENALMAHPSVREAAVIAIPHPKWQERPLAAVVLREGMQVTPAELRAHLASTFRRWQMPDAFVFLAEIPRTSVGKFQKSKLREMFRDWRAAKTE